MILLVDDDEQELEAVRSAVSNQSSVILTVANVSDAVSTIAEAPVAVVITDLALRSRGLDYEGLRILEAANRKRPPVPVIIFTAYPTAKGVEAAIELGVFDFIDRAHQGFEPLDMLRHKVRLAIRYYSALKSTSRVD